MPLQCPHCKTAQAEDRTFCIHCNLPLETPTPFSFAPPASLTARPPADGHETPVRPLVRAAPFSSAPKPEPSPASDSFEEPSESFQTLEQSARRPFEPISFLAGIGGAAAIAVVGFGLFSLPRPHPSAVAVPPPERAAERNQAENFLVTADPAAKSENETSGEASTTKNETPASEESADAGEKTPTVQIESSEEGVSVPVGTPVTITWTPSKPGIYEFSARDVDGDARTARSRTLVLAAGEQIAPPRIAPRETVRESFSSLPEIPPAPPLPPMPSLPAPLESVAVRAMPVSVQVAAPVVKLPASKSVMPLKSARVPAKADLTVPPKILVSPFLEGSVGPDAPPTILKSAPNSDGEDSPAPPVAPVFHVVASVFPFFDNADRFAGALRARGFHPSIHKSVSNGQTRYVVEAGAYREPEIARQKLTILQRTGYQARLFVGN